MFRLRQAIACLYKSQTNSHLQNTEETLGRTTYRPCRQSSVFKRTTRLNQRIPKSKYLSPIYVWVQLKSFSSTSEKVWVKMRQLRLHPKLGTRIHGQLGMEKSNLQKLRSNHSEVEDFFLYLRLLSSRA